MKIIAMLCAMLCLVSCSSKNEVKSVSAMRWEKQEVEVSAAVEVFDTSILNGWCGEPEGKIRMTGGWYYSEGVVQDETGNLWEWNGDLDETDFCLLWIDDRGTPEIEDDFLVKVWVENY